jgi:hypothetical protein
VEAQGRQHTTSSHLSLAIVYRSIYFRCNAVASVKVIVVVIVIVYLREDYLLILCGRRLLIAQQDRAQLILLLRQCQASLQGNVAPIKRSLVLTLRCGIFEVVRRTTTSTN